MQRATSTPVKPLVLAAQLVNETAAPIRVSIQVSKRALLCDAARGVDGARILADVLPAPIDAYSVPAWARLAGVHQDLLPKQSMELVHTTGVECAAVRVWTETGLFERRVLVRDGSIFALRRDPRGAQVLVDTASGAVIEATPDAAFEATPPCPPPTQLLRVSSVASVGTLTVRNVEAATVANEQCTRVTASRGPIDREWTICPASWWPFAPGAALAAVGARQADGLDILFSFIEETPTTLTQRRVVAYRATPQQLAPIVGMLSLEPEGEMCRSELGLARVARVVVTADGAKTAVDPGFRYRATPKDEILIHYAQRIYSGVTEAVGDRIDVVVTTKP